MAIDINLNSQYPVITPQTQVAIYEKHIQDTSSLKLVMPPILPEQTNNIKYCSPVLNQQGQNGCIASTIASMIEYYQIKNSKAYTSLSAKALYYWTRDFEHLANTDYGIVKPSDAFDIAKNIGIPSEKYHSNSCENLLVKPSDDAVKDASLNKINNWNQLVYGFNVNNLDAIEKSLANGDVVSIGIYESYDLYYPPNTGIVDATVNNLLQENLGHEIMVIDYKTDAETGKKLFLCENSLGENYGIKPEEATSRGYIWLTEDYIEQGCYFAASIEM